MALNDQFNYSVVYLNNELGMLMGNVKYLYSPMWLLFLYYFQAKMAREDITF